MCFQSQHVTLLHLLFIATLARADFYFETQANQPDVDDITEKSPAGASFVIVLYRLTSWDENCGNGVIVEVYSLCSFHLDIVLKAFHQSNTNEFQQFGSILGELFFTSTMAEHMI